MDPLSLMRRAASALLLGALGVQAWAQTQCYEYSIIDSAVTPSVTYKAPTAAAVCAQYTQATVRNRVQTEVGSGPTYYRVQYSTANLGNSESQCDFRMDQIITQANYTFTQAGTATSVPITKAAVTCPPAPATCKADGESYGQDGKMWVIEGQSTPSSSMCYNGCTVRGSMAGTQDGNNYIWGPLTSDGGTPCQGGGGGQSGTGSGPPNGVPSPAPSASNPSPTPPPPGMCPGTVNGTPVVVPCGNTAAPPAKDTGTKTEPNPAGGTTTTSTESKAETKCTETTCVTTVTTTTTTTNSNGTPGTTKTETTTGTDTKSNYCAKNPGDAQCKGTGGTGTDPSTFGGSCSGGFQCSGDAVQCAMAREQFVRNCQVFEDTSTQRQTGMDGMSAGTRPSTHPGQNPQNVSLANGFDQTPLISGSCPADYTVNIGGGQSVVIEFSRLCDPAGTLGNLLVGITALCCLGIVFIGRSNA